MIRRPALPAPLLGIGLVALACASTSAGHEPTRAWSQQAATGLAGQLDAYYGAQ